LARRWGHNLQRPSPTSGIAMTRELASDDEADAVSDRTLGAGGVSRRILGGRHATIVSRV
jgi:hypothetical protein